MIRPLIALGALVACCVIAPTATSAPRAGDVLPQTLIVQYEDGVSTLQARGALRRVSREASITRRLRSGIEIIRVPVGREDAVLAELAADPAVKTVVRDQVVQAQRTPDDTLYGRMWGLHNAGQSVSGVFSAGTVDADIDAPEAWERRTTGAVTAIVDSGVDFTHPDLTCNKWTNAGEVGGGRETNGIDDDGNGYVDDWQGWDFVEGNNDPTDDVKGHGTHVAGTVAACGNNGVGVTGIAWSAPIMAVRVLGDTGSGSWSGVISGFDYAGRMGARVANASLGADASSSTISLFSTEIAEWPNTLFALAAGNNSTDLSSTVYAPCEVSASRTNAICVSATTNTDALSSFSNYGPNATIAAPGSAIYSSCTATLAADCNGSSYVAWYGTSMATPHVSGVASLVFAQKSSLTGAQARTVLQDTADVVAGLTSVPGGKRLNANAALAAVSDVTPPGTFSVTAPVADSVIGAQPLIAWSAATDETALAGYDVLIDGAQVASVGANVTSYQSAGLAHGAHVVQVRARDASGNATLSASRAFVLDLTAPVAPVITAPASGAIVGSQATISWSAATDEESLITGYRVLVDGTPVASVGSVVRSYSHEFTAGGAHTISVEATNGVGATATSVQVVQVDLTPPSIPTLAMPAAGAVVGVGPVSFSWGAASDALAGGVTYRLVVGGVSVATGGTSLARTVFAGATSWHVEAVDAVGNVSTSASRALVVDDTAPSAPTITAPGALSWVGGATVIRWDPSSDGESAIFAYRISVDGVVIDTVDGAERSYALPLTTAGTRTVSIAAINGVGIVGAAAQRELRVDLAGPTAPSLLLPAAGAVPEPGSVTFTWGAATDAGAGVAGYRLQVGEVEVDLGAGVTSHALALGVGAHPWRVVAYDALGNETPSAQRALYIDDTAPSAPVITTPPAEGWSGPQVDLFWNGSSDGESAIAEYRVIVNGDVVATLPASAREYTVTLSQGGQAAITVSAVNGAGLATPAVSYVVQADVTAPDAPVLQGPSGLQAPGTQRFSWNDARDAQSGISGYELVVGETRVALGATITSYELPLSHGEYTWYVNARNGAGLVAASAPQSISVRASDPNPGTDPTGDPEVPDPQDAEPPLQINGGDSYTRRAQVTLNLPAGATDIRAAQNRTLSGAIAIDEDDPRYTLRGADGRKTVYVRYALNDAVVSAQAAIILDRAAPVIASRVTARRGTKVTLQIRAAGGPAGMASLVARTTRAKAPHAALTVTVSRGTKVVVRARDRAGNATVRTIVAR